MFYTGVVEERLSDPLKLGRCKVRIVGLHTADKIELPTDDLPWAVIMQPVNSAAVSGIGISPTGIVEGAIVVVTFLDEYKQQPIIIGSIAGIPSPRVDQTIKVVETTESLEWGSDGQSTEWYTNANGKQKRKNEAGETEVKSGTIKMPTGNLVPSEAAYESIREEEKLSSLTKGSNKYVSYKTYKTLAESTLLYAYKDTKNLWTIGWGSRYLLDGSEVKEDTVITVQEADKILKKRVESEFGAQIRKALKAPVTQSMFDALVSIGWNTGVSGLVNTPMFNAINALNYTTAASLIPSTKTNAGALSARREREKQLFSKDGYPSKDLSSVEPDPAQKEEDVAPDATENPVVDLKTDTQTSGADTTYTTRTTEGFKDPNGVYPKIFNEPDTHRLARHEKIDQTIVAVKEAARVTGVVSGGKGKWSQPKIPYNAKYPYNHVRVSESGHVQEIDDTPGNERLHTYHKSGTYSEIDVNGTRVNRIVGDDYEILERNGNVLIKGSLNVTIVGNHNIRVENNANIDVLGDVTMTVGGDMKTGVTGNYFVKADGVIGLDAPTIWFNSGKASGVQTGKGSAAGLPQFPTLNTPNRNDEKIAQYETPEDGDATEYNGKLEDNGITSDEEPNSMGDDPKTPSETPTNTETPADEVPSKQAEPVDVSCESLSEPIPRSYKLSSNFTVADLDPKNALAGKPSVSITKSEIVCNMKALAENCLEPIKKRYPNITFSSGYRNYVPNGGATNSDHMYGAAVDVIFNGFSRQQVFDAAHELVKILPAWTQVILEYDGSSTWIHVAYNSKRGLNMQKFTMNHHKRYGDMGKFYLV